MTVPHRAPLVSQLRCWAEAFYRLRYALAPAIAAVSTLTIVVMLLPLLWVHWPGGAVRPVDDFTG
jgi:hypothetical protein